MAFLKVLESPDPALKDQTIPLAGKEVLIGRGKENGLVLEDHAVSRHHARIVEEPDGHVLVDNNSANGSWVNGQRVTEQRLKPGDQIRVGKTLFEIQGVYDPEGTALAGRAGDGDVHEAGSRSGSRPGPGRRRSLARRRARAAASGAASRRPVLRPGHRPGARADAPAGAPADADSGSDSRPRPARTDAAARSHGRPSAGPGAASRAGPDGRPSGADASCARAGCARPPPTSVTRRRSRESRPASGSGSSPT